MLTQKQKLQVLNFFNTQVTDTLGIVQTCYDEDKTWERQYDATTRHEATHLLPTTLTMSYGIWIRNIGTLFTKHF